METIEQNNESLCIYSILSCLLLSITYVASLYIWSSPHNRDHPSIIKKRFFSVFVVTLISPAFLYLGMSKQLLEKFTIWELLGIRWSGLIPAILMPLILTMILFLGPLSILVIDRHISRLYVEITSGSIRFDNINTIVWWRNQIIAPLSEEFTFRACMMPLLLQCFSPNVAIFICPLFFGAAHFHHLVGNTRMGIQLKRAVILSVFQFAYTTLFGTYAAFLFVKTGHYMAPFAVHSFCNYMGFPDFEEVLAYKNPLKKVGVLSLFIIGFIAWCYLLTPLTNPAWFNNNLFWRKYYH